MAAVQNFPFFVIMLYLTGGVVCSVLRARAAARYCLALNAVSAGMMAMTLAWTLRSGTSYVYLMGHFPAPWGNELRVGPLETLLALCFCGVMLLTLMGGMEHIFEDCEPEKINLYFGAVSLLMSSIVAILFTNDLFTAYVFIEISSITSCAVIAVNYKNGAALVATTRYRIMGLLGSGVFLIGIAMLYDLTGHLLLENLGAAVKAVNRDASAVFPLTIIIGLFSVGMGVKSALFPFHTWLPG
ncbi:MAG: sodium:proton antiporter, partial [Oscillospiraceae bacterium]|nr:sodium:proton antiporter [Oscillospiraceae bacterium]